ncbi:MAG: LPS assembly lipoprotein LptE [Acetobacteraceae bacterium]
MSVDPTRRGFLTGLVAAGTAAGLAGCGFQPVYMPTATGQQGVVARQLAAVNVGIIPDRPGQLLRQALQVRLGNDSGVRQRYDLAVAFWISGDGIGILPDNSVTRVRVTGHVNWALLSQDQARTRLTTGSALALDGMNIFNQQYFALDLENETVQRRLAENLADQVTTQLAIWFRQQAAASGTG